MENKIPRVRTLPAAIAELKRDDPSTAYTLRALRRAVNAGEIPSMQIGSKRLVDLNILFERLSCPLQEYQAGEQYGKVRRIN